MNRRLKMKKMKQEIERLRNLSIKPKIELQIDGLQHMRCKTAFYIDDVWMSPKVKEDIAVKRISDQMTDVIRKKIIRHVNPYLCRPAIEEYTFDFWVKENVDGR